MAPHARPESVLKRAEELIAVDQKSSALQMLHDVITAKRTKSASLTSLEPIMLLYFELCVELKKGKLAKEGLYQYRNLAQNVSVSSIETVLKKFLSLAEAKVSDAQAHADKMQVDVDDLEATEAPEDMMLASVSTEQSKDRTDRAVVTPWLKFLWEAYRTVLDTFRNNSRLEVMYHSTVQQAFDFCLKYTRKTEFRRLCELLRSHLQNAVRYSSQPHSIDLSDHETFQRHLDTRFDQLNAAVDLELWQEAFRSIEDIHTLFTLSKKSVQQNMMITYFEKLARIFLVSDNYLFHAAALNRYYHTFCSVNAHSKDVLDSQLEKLSSLVVLSALSIPDFDSSKTSVSSFSLFGAETDDTEKHKNNRLANLLNVPRPPTRQNLLKDALAKNILGKSCPEVKELYQILEIDFHPLLISKRIAPVIKKLVASISNTSANSENTESTTKSSSIRDLDYSIYLNPLKNVILTRLFEQLSQIYDNVKIDFLIKLTNFDASFSLSLSYIEKFVMSLCKSGRLSLYIDHTRGLIVFKSEIFTTDPSYYTSLSGSSSAASAAAAAAAATASNLLSSSTSQSFLPPALLAKRISEPSFTLQTTRAQAARTALSRLARVLHASLLAVDAEFIDAKVRRRKEALERAFSTSAFAEDTVKGKSKLTGVEKEHLAVLVRKNLIARRVEAIERERTKKEEEESAKRRAKALAESEENKRRAAEEARRLEIERIERERASIKEEERKKLAEDIRAKGLTSKLGIDIEKLDDLDTDKLRLLHIEQLEKETKDVRDKMRITSKRMDHLERAFRREEIPLIKEDYEEQKKSDLQKHDARHEALVKSSKIEHDKKMELHSRLKRLLPDYEKFRAKIEEERAVQLEKLRSDAAAALEADKKKRIAEVKARRIKEEAERAAREKAEEEARIAKEKAEEEARRRDKEKAEALKKYLADQSELNKKNDEIEARRRKREEEIEARKSKQRNPFLALSDDASKKTVDAPVPRRSDDGPKRNAYKPPIARSNASATTAHTSTSNNNADTSQPPSSKSTSDKYKPRSNPFGNARPVAASEPIKPPTRSSTNSYKPPMRQQTKPQDSSKESSDKSQNTPANKPGKYVPVHKRS